MIRLSVNINKIATLRNARGGNTPNVVEAAKRLESFGAQGITVHPRPDERHIRYADVRDLTKVVTTEFNIEGNPNQKFIDLVLEAKPAQVTLVPDAEDVLTSNAGWDTIKNKAFLTEVISKFKAHGIRTSIFVDPNIEMIQGAAEVGTDRIELYTESYAQGYTEDKIKAIQPYIICAEEAKRLGLGINAGHDLSLDNIEFFAHKIPFLDEVSIGHALISEALYDGLQPVVNAYLKKLS
ncbi:pyridoxine 5'-phosphate synthase [Psychroflexus sp. CAK57W]|uniref:pyridoxine 5'-phosphate synthase n=1 Tax=Psychroflexus curvus TaxID=2873595 RepID=UPI001CCB5056|nr:pyridoxine 5'-phosphate synthase [Psychroflexus curvus]MBZ9786760.1 pyridoxine 5'-phosphate synthase [Psychroflexus curvus]